MEIGVSKTVLYRYFADKNDLTNAAMSRFFETILAPRIYLSIAQEVDEAALARNVIAAYVETVDADTEIYLYVMSNGAGPGNQVVADSERMIAELVATAVGQRIRDRGLDSGGVVPWAYALVGAVQLATHWWISNKEMSRSDLIDYLTMMVWNAVEGIARDGGSPAKFKARPRALPDPA